MSAKITTKFGEAVPPVFRHSVTVHMGGWETVERYGDDSSSVIPQFKNAYPRMKPHRDIVNSARECVAYSISSRRVDSNGKSPVSPEQIEIRAFHAKDLFYAVIFPLDQRSTVAGFWSIPGAGVSSRFAEANLKQLGQLKEVPVTEDEYSRPRFDSPIHQVLRERILSYLERAPLHPDQGPRPSATDIYFYPTGMASIYKPHSYMLKHSQGTTVLFGMAFMNTLTAFEDFGPGCKFFGNGSDEDLSDLEAFLEEERRQGRKVQAMWTEFPANPLLVAPNIERLRALADEYDVVLGLDDTIGSWANIEVTGLADILVTSVTKSFNGYADVIAGSAILNPASPQYPRLKSLFDEHYVPELYVEDAVAIERNSRDYLSRTARLNANASALAEYLQSCAEDPNSPVRQVHYPSVNSSGVYYKRFMRPATDDFAPGYGCLFSVELDNMPTTMAFYDNLNVHKSVHLGAPSTLAFAYTMCTYKKDLPWAAKYGLKPTQIRVSAGLEDTEVLLQDFKIAVEAATKCKNKASELI
ncbi:uncharacterized protein TRIVIDRAFT_154512 [Trichoderma virens Gv29-8]|uniref:Cystathionine gamma-synthase n=1 Tax=Hypocrea virens (strain Gv29-8 / FGSC 10586) TaxID=413071 RepID=G9MYF8_HYPVG|nr:uncharacterized protein TRIVIDRAFT_154512 [Trichoderma virens Gv29-8]EHK20580.1 hypothetical protein TRIVIDRAFT_154512 [Trichoderma virens Gv29-8]UKZ53039.1 hypothetical protein TrVGV298_006826 [Trichoderma virens]